MKTNILKNKTVQKTAGNGMKLSTIIFIIFLVMKLGEVGQVANWSWWWVTSPLWIGWGFILGLIGAFFCIVIGIMILVGLANLIFK